MADVSLVNLNMLYVRYLDRVEREIHLPLGTLYLARALEDAGIEVDFRDYQLHDEWDLFNDDAMMRFLEAPAPVLFVSCMANLLPFTMMALERFHRDYPEVKVALGGVGPFAVEERVLQLAPWIDVVGTGEMERSAPALVRALQNRGRLADVPGIWWRDGDRIVSNPSPPRIEDLDTIPFPAHHLVDLGQYQGVNIISSRGCPYLCTFCSVAPIWGRTPFLRSAENILEEMAFLKAEAGAELFLFQDEYFVSTPDRVLDLCKAIKGSGLDVRWKAFGRVDLTDLPVMEAMADAGCIELRYGIESGSDKILERTQKGFTAAHAQEVVSRALGIFPRVDAFYMWGFPYETMEDFQQTLLQMITVRGMGARILPSLLSLLPQSTVYDEVRDEVELEFCPELFPEYMLTGHEVCSDGRVSIAPEHERIYEFIRSHPDVFPGFFHVNLEHNVMPKYELLQKFGFYETEGRHELLGTETESCGAHSPREE